MATFQRCLSSPRSESHYKIHSTAELLRSAYISDRLGPTERFELSQMLSLRKLVGPKIHDFGS